MTSPAPEPPHHAAPKVSLVTRLLILDNADMARWVAENLPGEDPAGVLNAAAAPDHSVIVVRSSLTRPQRRRAVHEALAGVRRFPRIAAIPVLGMAGARSFLRRIEAFLYGGADAAQSVVQAASNHMQGVLAAGAAVVAATAVGITVAATVPHHATPGSPPRFPSSRAHHGRRRVVVRLPARPLSYLGVYEPDSPASFAGVTRFAGDIGEDPDIAMYYSGWLEPFQTAFADAARLAGAVPLVAIDPDGTSLADIASGKYDAYLTSYASAVMAYGGGVIISLAHEPNGSWYPWGFTRATPAQWTAAWRHVVTVFRRQGAGNVTWLWTMSHNTREPWPLSAWWPGAKYVTWVGIDGYFALPGDTFSSVFGPALRQIRQFTSAPVLISETGVGPLAGQQRGIADLFAGIRKLRCLGFVWFDQAQRDGTAHQDWRIEDSPVALAAFRQQVRGPRILGGSKGGLARLVPSPSATLPPGAVSLPVPAALGPPPSRPQAAGSLPAPRLHQKAVRKIAGKVRKVLRKILPPPGLPVPCVLGVCLP